MYLDGWGILLPGPLLNSNFPSQTVLFMTRPAGLITSEVVPYVVRFQEGALMKARASLPCLLSQTPTPPGDAEISLDNLGM